MPTHDITSLPQNKLLQLITPFIDINPHFSIPDHPIQTTFYTIHNKRYLYSLDRPLVFAQVRHITLLRFLHILLFRGGPTLLSQPSNYTSSHIRNFLIDIRNLHENNYFTIINLVSYQHYDSSVSLGLLEAGYLRSSFQRDPYFTFILDLSLSEATLFKNLSSKWRNQYRKAVTYHLHYEFGTLADYIEAYLSIHNSMCEHKKLTNYRLTSEDLYSLYQYYGEVYISLVYKDDQPISGCVVALNASTSHYLFAASTPYGRTLNSSNFMLWETIKVLKERGTPSLDLSSVNPAANWGGYHFKKNTGAHLVPYQGEWSLSNPSFLHHFFSFVLYLRTKRLYY